MDEFFKQFTRKPFHPSDVAAPKATPDPEPGVREPEPGTDFLPPDPLLPAVSVHNRDILEVLEGIEYNTSGLNTNEGIIWQPLISRLPAGPGDSSLIGSERVRHIYIPDVPRSMRVYTGSSRGTFLGSLQKGQSLQTELPYSTNGVYIEYDAGGANEQITVYMSSRPIDISIFGSEPKTEPNRTIQAKRNNVSTDLAYTPVASDSETSGQASLTTAAFNYVFNGSTFDRARGDITNGLDVDVTRVQGNVSTKEVGGASFTNTAVSVGTTQVTLIASSTTRRRLRIRNLGTANVFIGSATSVTIANGYPILPNSEVIIETTATVYAISGTAGQDVRVLSEGN